MKNSRPSRRTILSTPGDRWDLLIKQQAAMSDVVMIDLEHAVHRDKKSEALDNCTRAVRTLRHSAAEIIVRINNPHDDQFLHDVRALCKNPPSGYLIPKVADVADALRAVDAIEWIEAEENKSGSKPGLWFLIESPGALLQSEAIAKLPRTEALLLGHGDLEYSVGFLNRGWVHTPALDFARHMLVFAAAAGEVDAIDGAITGFVDATVVEAQARHSAQMGMAGVLIVSPRQIAPVHRGFRPSDVEIKKAYRIITAFLAAWRKGSGVAVVDGNFVDDVLAMRAREVLRQAGETVADFDSVFYLQQEGGL